MFDDPHSQTAGFIPEFQQELLLPGGEKSRRGWAHIETAYLLCPERYLDEFKHDPEYISFPSIYPLISFVAMLFMEQVMSGEWRIDPHDIPHFCYHEEARHDENQDEEFDEIEGLFGGFLIERVSIYHTRWPFLLIFEFGRGCDTFLLAQSQHSIHFTIHQGQKAKNGGWMQSHQRWWRIRVYRYSFI